MVYLEYEINTKQVVEIHESEPTLLTGYDYAISEQYALGDEFEKTIWINSVDENKNLISDSAIRNNPQARRLLEENEQLKAKIQMQDATMEELMFIIIPELNGGGI
ncbi:hypothetical protein JOD21_000313 [Jeotgalibacillus terrae]|uniref:hypothetical protein n=1 Tax=Jeotgalibacillus terrae TaxID=587735 RepID=UPI00195C8C58|nr:hypothetical protein [Jeotgalibacillus terrae]MBM7577657.1 hypothetical protein [Jeotgalibacillus terrae]